MSNTVLLNNIEHKDLRVSTKMSAEYGHKVGRTLISTNEFGRVLHEYPILFCKNTATSKFQAVALFGFSEDENLFLDDDGWHASYIPHVLAKGPFFIGFQNQMIDGVEKKTSVIHVDIDDPRVNQNSGESAFLEFGGNTPYLEHIQTVLKQANDGITLTEIMFDSFEQLDLIEPISLEIDVTAEHRFILKNYYTINDVKLAQLKGEKLDFLHQSGFLQAAHQIISSLQNIQRLISLKQERLMK